MQLHRFHPWRPESAATGSCAEIVQDHAGLRRRYHTSGLDSYEGENEIVESAKVKGFSVVEVVQIKHRPTKVYGEARRGFHRCGARQIKNSPLLKALKSRGGTRIHKELGGITQHETESPNL